MKPTPRQHCAGFTLIEALVALLILAIASAGLMGAVEAHVDTIRGLELRAGAQWVAENRLAELRLGPGALPASAMVRLLDQNWRVTQKIGGSQDPDIKAVTIDVAPANGHGPHVALRGFVDAGTITP